MKKIFRKTHFEKILALIELCVNYVNMIKNEKGQTKNVSEKKNINKNK